MFGGLGYGEMLLCGVIALILFGSKLPEVARNLGGSYRELRKHLTDFQREFTRIDDYVPPKGPTYEQDDAPSTSSDSEVSGGAKKAARFVPPPSEEDNA